MYNYEVPKLKEVILDSGPLLLVLTIHFTNFYKRDDREALIKRVYSKLDKIPNPVYNLNKFFNSIDFLHTTPHAIGEVIGLVRSRLSLKEHENEFWVSTLDFIKVKKMSEQLIPLIELSKDLKFCPLIDKIGIVDTELIKFAKESNMPILSIDKRTLKHEAEKRNVDVLIIDDDIYKYIPNY